jgi:HD-GYP domain-containing protein (c-di-GMP phosphodiesterase class II)
MTLTIETERQTPLQAADSAVALRQLLERAVGLEIGVFSPDRMRYPPTCQRDCMEAGPDGRLRGPCPLLRDLSTAVAPLEQPGRCDLGHSVAIHMEDMSGSVVLVLQPVDNSDGLGWPGPELGQLQAIGQLWDQCQRWVDENNGLANEVLRTYEQLNVLFDITQQICETQDAAQVKLSIIRRLAETLNCDWSCCLSPEDGVLWWCGSESEDRSRIVSAIEERCAELILEVRERQLIKVYNRTSGPEGDDWPSLLFAPLKGEAAALDILVFGRRSPKPAFLSGDMLMVDSVLSHAQHVIANLKLTERLRTMSLEAVRAFTSAIDKKDRYTSGHSERVGFIARLIGEELGLSAQDLQDLEWGGVLHDVGKIGIHDEILAKPGKLTPEEYAIIKQHSRMSHDIIAPIKSFESIRELVLYHHETPDGSGYPEGLRGEAIPLAARIVHVADTFDALTSSRSYRAKYSLAQAWEIMHKDKGTKLDAPIVEAFERAFRRFMTTQPGRFAKVFPHIEESGT